MGVSRERLYFFFFNLLFVKPKLTRIDWQDTLFAALKKASQPCDKQLNTTS